MKKIIVILIFTGFLSSSAIANVNNPDFDLNVLNFEEETTSFHSYYIPLADIYVDDDNTQGPWDGTLQHPYKHIQDGIDSSVNGDVIFVFNGTYYEQLDVTKSVKIIGENKQNTIIDGNWNYEFLITFAASNVKISRFTISGARNPSLLHANYWAIFSTTTNNHIIKDNIFDRNDNGIWFEHSENNLIKNNKFIISDNLSEISVNAFKFITVKDTIVADNEIYHFTTFIKLLYGSNYNEINKNTIYTYRAVILGDSNYNTIKENKIVPDNAGIQLFRSSNNEIIENEVLNVVKDKGHCIDLEEANNNKISGNTLTRGLIGINMYDSRNNLFYHNNLLDIRFYVFYDDNGRYYNTWYNKQLNEGNYWKDFTIWGDRNGDGIVDIPYIMNLYNIDWKPLMNPTNC
jgi:parallel beta-helix repeat protein